MTQEPSQQTKIDTRALEIATEANTTAKHAVLGLDKLFAWTKEHEAHDEQRFQSMDTKISEGFKGVYNRLWGFAILILGGIGAVALLLANALIDKL